MIKGLGKKLKIKSGHKYFSVTYMCIWLTAMNKTIMKINKTTTILNNFSNCFQFYFSVLLKNGKIGPRRPVWQKRTKTLYVPRVKLNKNRSENFLAFVSTRTWTSLDIKSRCHQKKLEWPTCFGPFSKWPPSKSGNHVLCHNLSSTAVRITELVSTHMFWGARNSIMPIKYVSVLLKIHKQLFKRIFCAFSVIFVLVDGPEKITVHPPPMNV